MAKSRRVEVDRANSARKRPPGATDRGVELCTQGRAACLSRSDRRRPRGRRPHQKHRSQGLCAPGRFKPRSKGPSGDGVSPQPPPRCSSAMGLHARFREIGIESPLYSSSSLHFTPPKGSAPRRCSLISAWNAQANSATSSGASRCSLQRTEHQILDHLPRDPSATVAAPW